MQVHHVVPRIHEEASGPSYSVPALCDSLVELDVQTHLHVLQPLPARSFLCSIHGYPHILPPKRLGVSPAMRAGLMAAGRHADIVHNHSLWMMPNIYAAQAARRHAARLVLSPRGTLQPWSLRRHRWRKRLLWWMGQKETVRKAACVHATAESELAAVRALGLTVPVAVIPNGINIPDVPPLRNRQGAKRVLFLGRIHPVKGVDLLVRVWPRLQPRFPDWELHITGLDTNGLMGDMQELAVDLQARNIHFSGAAYGRAKSDAYRQASLYVLPSHTENFGLTIAEALAHGVPVIATQGTPWSRLEQQGCGWWIERNLAALESSLAEAMSLSDQQLQAMGDRGRRWMQQEYSWTRVGQMMRQSYEWLLGGGAAPAWIDLAPTPRVPRRSVSGITKKPTRPRAA